jgi:hypothetical protein
MTATASFTPSQAAAITGVSVDSQRDWRRRMFLPGNPGGWTRYSLRDLCRLRLMRALVECGLPIGVAVAHISDDFLDALQSQVQTHGRAEYDEMFAVVGLFADIDDIDEAYFRAVYFDLSDIGQLQHCNPPVKFKSLIVIPLAVLAADLVANARN